MQTIKQAVSHFFARHWDQRSPLILALSGGPDSLALYHLLKEYPLLIAHVDHGWREQSAQEAEQLEALARSNRHPFHLHQLAPFAKDAENQARQARYRFFHTLYEQTDAQALILAHHRDDQAETVLKRLFEGSTPLALSGMQPTAQFQSMPLWRPLLFTPKAKIRAYLDFHTLTPFDDPTNRDPKYLRARMREQLIPALEEQFGKKLSGPLVHISEEIREITEWMDQLIEPYLAPELHLKEHPLPPPLLRHLLRKWILLKDLSASREVIARAVQAIQNGDCQVKLPLLGGSWLHVHNYRVRIEFCGQMRYDQVDTPPKKESP